ncbi:zinc ribbon domain-containing protein [Streptomyces mirabilis]
MGWAGNFDSCAKHQSWNGAAHRKSFRSPGAKTSPAIGEEQDHQGGVVHKVPASGTSQGCSVCHVTMAGSRESQAVFGCKNSACGWIGNADHNAARNVLSDVGVRGGRPEAASRSRY